MKYEVLDTSKQVDEMSFIARRNNEATIALQGQARQSQSVFRYKKLYNRACEFNKVKYSTLTYKNSV